MKIPAHLNAIYHRKAGTNGWSVWKTFLIQGIFTMNVHGFNQVDKSSGTDGKLIFVLKLGKCRRTKSESAKKIMLFFIPKLRFVFPITDKSLYEILFR
jgi:hypothetical protein